MERENELGECEDLFKKKQKEIEEVSLAEKKRRKAEMKMVGVGRPEYCHSLRIVLRNKFGAKSKE